MRTDTPQKTTHCTNFDGIVATTDITTSSRTVETLCGAIATNASATTSDTGDAISMAMVSRAIAKCEPAHLMGRVLHLTWPEEMCEHQPIYFHGKPVAFVDTVPCQHSVCVGVCVVEPVFEGPTDILRLVTCVDGTCHVRDGQLIGSGCRPGQSPFHCGAIKLTLVVDCAPSGWIALVECEDRKDRP